MPARPVRTEAIPERIVVIGCAGSGKTTLARTLAVRLGARHIERDALGDDEAPGFALQVAAPVKAAGSRWVFDGAPLQRRAGCLSARQYRCRPGLSTPGRAAARPGSVGPALVDPPRRWSTHLRLPAVALVGARPPGQLGREDPCCSAHRDRRVVRTARVGPRAAAAVHLAAPGGFVAGQPELIASSASDGAGREACQRSALSCPCCWGAWETFLYTLKAVLGHP